MCKCGLGGDLVVGYVKEWNIVCGVAEFYSPAAYKCLAGLIYCELGSHKPIN